MKELIRHPEHLEPDPMKREGFCPVAIRSESKMMSIPEVRKAVIEASNKSKKLEVFWKFCSQHGINSDAEPEWFEHMKKVTTPSSSSK